MALEAIQLDDLNWADMVSAARGRIAAVSNRKWTLHSPIDPGITIIELLAYLLEQRLYMLDQVPDSLVHAMVTLLGETARSTQQATTVLTLNHASEKPEEIPQGSVLQLQKNTAIRFTTQKTITFLPITRVEVYVAGKDRSQDLIPQRGVEVLANQYQAAEFQIILWLAKDAAMPTAASLSLLLQLDASPGIPAQWSNEAVDDVPPPAELTWWYRNAQTGQQVEFNKSQVEDGSGGLRRSGIVQITTPQHWAVEKTDSQGNKAYRLTVRTENASYTTAPRLLALLPNVVWARHGHAVEIPPEQLTSQLEAWLPLPAQRLQLPQDHHLPIEDHVTFSLQEKDGEWYAWSPTNDLSFHTREERVFLVDRDAGMLTFGDGLTGRIPLPNKTPGVRLCCELGGGIAGNLGANLGWEGQEDIKLTAFNPVNAEGGAEAETIEALRERTAAALKKRHRAVTSPDYIALAETTPGVAIVRAYAAIGHHPQHPCTRVPGAITVFVVPYAQRDDLNTREWSDEFVMTPQPDPGALEAVCRYLGERRLIGNEVYVRPPVYRCVTVVVDIAADPDDPLLLREQVHDRLARYLDPLVGGDDGTGWPFGNTLRPSALLRQVQELLGEGAQVNRVSIGLDAATILEDCNDVEIGSYELVHLNALTVNLQRQAATTGGLR